MQLSLEQESRSADNGVKRWLRVYAPSLAYHALTVAFIRLPLLRQAGFGFCRRDDALRCPRRITEGNIAQKREGRTTATSVRLRLVGNAYKRTWRRQKERLPLSEMLAGTKRQKYYGAAERRQT